MWISIEGECYNQLAEKGGEEEGGLQKIFFGH